MTFFNCYILSEENSSEEQFSVSIRWTNFPQTIRKVIESIGIQPQRQQQTRILHESASYKPFNIVITNKAAKKQIIPLMAVKAIAAFLSDYDPKDYQLRIRYRMSEISSPQKIRGISIDTNLFIPLLSRYCYFYIFFDIYTYKIVRMIKIYFLSYQLTKNIVLLKTDNYMKNSQRISSLCQVKNDRGISTYINSEIFLKAKEIFP